MLTEQKLKYVALRRAGVEKKQAAIGAKYSAKTAPQAASRLERDPEVQAAIAAPGETLLPQEILESRMPKFQEAKQPKPTEEPDPNSLIDVNDYADPKDFLTDVMNDKTLNKAMRHDAAKNLMPYFHGKIGEMGKKEVKKKEAGEVRQTTPFRPRAVK